jgi:hypothetical protein
MGVLSSVLIAWRIKKYTSTELVQDLATDWFHWVWLRIFPSTDSWWTRALAVFPNRINLTSTAMGSFPIYNPLFCHFYFTQIPGIHFTLHWTYILHFEWPMPFIFPIWRYMYWGAFIVYFIEDNPTVFYYLHCLVRRLFIAIFIARMVCCLQMRLTWWYSHTSQRPMELAIIYFNSKSIWVFETAIVLVNLSSCFADKADEHIIC